MAHAYNSLIHCDRQDRTVAWERRAAGADSRPVPQPGHGGARDRVRRRSVKPPDCQRAFCFPGSLLGSRSAWCGGAGTKAQVRVILFDTVTICDMERSFLCNPAPNHASRCCIHGLYASTSSRGQAARTLAPYIRVRYGARNLRIGPRGTETDLRDPKLPACAAPPESHGSRIGILRRVDQPGGRSSQRFKWHRFSPT
jgi:hypothetical protein